MFLLISAPGGNRTHDRLLKRELLYQLSYGRNMLLTHLDVIPLIRIQVYRSSLGIKHFNGIPGRFPELVRTSTRILIF